MEDGEAFLDSLQFLLRCQRGVPVPLVQILSREADVIVRTDRIARRCLIRCDAAIERERLHAFPGAAAQRQNQHTRVPNNTNRLHLTLLSQQPSSVNASTSLRTP